MKIPIIHKNKYTFSIDTSKNRVYFILHSGKWTTEDLNYFLPDWKEVLKEVKPFFTVVADVRNLEIQSPKFDKFHQEAQKYVTENGLLKLARILPINQDIVNLQFSRIADRSCIPYEVFVSLDDAENHLDKLVLELEKNQ